MIGIRGWWCIVIIRGVRGATDSNVLIIFDIVIVTRIDGKDVARRRKRSRRQWHTTLARVHGRRVDCVGMGRVGIGCMFLFVVYNVFYGC